ncbi:kinase-like domain-containing protein [Mycena alexandri]|uniref:Kinase-like domain-containing protein n=1 Tax=Mycena alexandri TaxID=1745969 RepID=A0AAD6X6S1_9AGAR|nr:kinase-like domain-containing protein [Mycena alexandri]
MVALIRKLATISPHYLCKLVLSSRMYGFTALEHARMLENWLAGSAPHCLAVGEDSSEHGLTTLIIHGVGTEQAPDVYAILSALKELHGLNIVVMCEPGVRPKRQRFTSEKLQILYVSDDGSIMYSGRIPSEPALYKNLFRILLEGVWQRPDATSLSIWEGMWERTNLPLDFDPESATTAGICSALHHAWDYSRWMLKLLANFLGVLPEALHVPDVVLLTGRPVKSGGFADIFHGQYTNQAGEKVEVALKVLRIFSSQANSERRIFEEKFTKEALSWSHLNHDNIVPFIGVNSTFPGQTMAMVSLWMAQGSVLTYMADRSLSSRSAFSLIRDVIQGISYLHAMNIVHGDLCGRNILINQNGRACLSDFGLAAFIEVQTSIKTSMRSGSGKWMAPELLLPEVYRPNHPFQRTVESDVWAFACVICEIWTEGTIPFVNKSEGAIIMKWSNPATEQGTWQLIPYTWPQTKSGQAMPQRLWELVQSCWKRNPILRPTVQVISQHISAMVPPRIRPTTLVQPLNLRPGTSSVQSRIIDHNHTYVRLGPLPADDGLPGTQFDPLLSRLLDSLERRDVIVAPLFVSRYDAHHLDLCFASAVEANSFAMTWMGRRASPYENAAAEIL